MQRLICIRHGEALHNVLHREHGHNDEVYTWDTCIDSPLTEAGKQQATDLGKTIMKQLNQPAQLIVVSPQHRTLHTAALILAADPFMAPMKTIALDCVREWSLGKDTPNRRMAISQYKRQFPHVDFSHLHSEEDTLWTAEEETMQSLDARVTEFKKWIKTRKETEIVLVGHNSFISYLLNGGIGEGDLSPEIKHCEPTIVVV